MENASSQRNRFRRSKEGEKDSVDMSNENIPLFSKPNKALSHSTYAFFTSSSYPSSSNPRIPKSPSGRVRRASNSKKVPFIFDSDSDSSEELVKLHIQEEIPDVPDVVMSDDEKEDNDEVKGINDNWKSKQRKNRSFLPPTPPRLPPHGARPRSGRQSLTHSISTEIYTEIGRGERDLLREKQSDGKDESEEKEVKEEKEDENPSPLRARRPQIKKIGRPMPRFRSASVPLEVEQHNEENEKKSVEADNFLPQKKRRRRSKVTFQEYQNGEDANDDDNSNKQNQRGNDEIVGNSDMHFDSTPRDIKSYDKYTIALEVESKLPKYRAQIRIFQDSEALYSVKFKGKMKDGIDLYVDQGKTAHISGDHTATIAVTNNRQDYSLRDGDRTEKELISVNVVNEDKLWCYIRGISDFAIPLKGITDSEEIKDMQEVTYRHSKTHDDFIKARFLTNHLIDISAYDQIGPLRLLVVGISLFQMKDCF